MATSNYISKSSISTSKDSIKYVVYICLLFAVLILGRAVNNNMFYVFAGVSFAVFLFSSVSHCFSLLLFLLPFSSILKTHVDGMSFFTLLFFLVVLKMLLTIKSIHSNMLVSLIILVLYCLLFSGLGQLTTIVTIIAGLAMVYYLQKVEVDTKTAIISYSLGIVGASTLALFKDSFYIVNMFVHNTILKLDTDNYASRFSGLQGNPNYYTLDIIVLLSVIIVMMYYKKAPKSFTVVLITLSVFGIMSVSKSFLFALILLIGFWFFLSIKQGVGKFTKFLMILIIGGAIAYFFAFDYLNTYFYRFVTDSGSSIESITTGRTDIWKVYVEAIFNDTKILFLGNGLKTILEGNKGAHNTYLESLFYLGIVGSGIFIAALKSSVGKIITRPAMWIPIIALLFRMLAIGILTYDSLWLYISLIVILSRELKVGTSVGVNTVCD